MEKEINDLMRLREHFLNFQAEQLEVCRTENGRVFRRYCRFEDFQVEPEKIYASSYRLESGEFCISTNILQTDDILRGGYKSEIFLGDIRIGTWADGKDGTYYEFYARYIKPKTKEEK